MKSRRGFSLTELLTVIAIIAVLGAFLFPVISAVKGRARIEDCQSRLHQVALGIEMYRSDNDGQGWLRYTSSRVRRTTAGRNRYPWNDWLPLAPYVKGSETVWCPLTTPNDGILYKNIRPLYFYPAVASTPDTIRVGYLFDADPARTVAFCSHHTTNEIERLDSASANYALLFKGQYPVVRADGSAKLVPSAQIQFWYLWADGSWNTTVSSQPASQVWRFPGDSWPPSLPWGTSR